MAAYEAKRGAGEGRWQPDTKRQPFGPGPRGRGRGGRGRGGSRDEEEDLTEVDWARRYEQRRKHIDKGKNTIGYHRYIQLVPREERTREHMSTPDPQARISKRRYDGQVRAWRRFLHKYDDTSDAHGTEDFTAELAAEAEDVAPEKETDSGEGAAAAASNELNASAQPSKSTDDAFESIKDVLYGEGDLDEVLDLL